MNKSIFALTCILFVTTSVIAESQEQSRDVKAEIEKFNADLSQSDRMIKYRKLEASPYAFYRGTNHLFWMDFANDQRLEDFSSEQTKTWLQGDLHVYNFGSFDNDKKEVVYNLNDFDESLVADYQYDVWRLATSLVLIGRLNRENDSSSFDLSDEDLEKVVDAFSKSYLDTLGQYVGNNDEKNEYFIARNTVGKLKDFLQDVGEPRPAEARKKMVEKWTDNGKFKSCEERKGKLGKPTKKETKTIKRAMGAYGGTLSGGLEYDNDYFEVKDVARRLLAGTGSIGTPRFYVLIEGKSKENDDDRILDIKRQGPPTAFSYGSTTAQGDGFKNDAIRHAKAYKALTKHTDDHLGWMTLSGIGNGVDGDYSVRERSPYKDSFPAWLDTHEKEKDQELVRKFGPTTQDHFKKLAEQWGMILATGHASADNDFDSALVPHSFEEHVTKLTKNKKKEDAFKNRVRTIAFEYATQVVEDQKSFKSAVDLPKSEEGELWVSNS